MSIADEPALVAYHGHDGDGGHTYAMPSAIVDSLPRKYTIDAVMNFIIRCCRSSHKKMRKGNPSLVLIMLRSSSRVVTTLLVSLLLLQSSGMVKDTEGKNGWILSDCRLVSPVGWALGHARRTNNNPMSGRPRTGWAIGTRPWPCEAIEPGANDHEKSKYSLNRRLSC